MRGRVIGATSPRSERSVKIGGTNWMRMLSANYTSIAVGVREGAVRAMAMHRATFNSKKKISMNYKEAYEILTNCQKDFEEVEKAFQKGAHELVANLAEELAAEIRADFPDVDPYDLDLDSIDFKDDVVVDEDGTTWAIIKLYHPDWDTCKDVKFNLSRLGGLYESFPWIVCANYSADELHYGFDGEENPYLCLYDIQEDLEARLDYLLSN